MTIATIASTPTFSIDDPPPEFDPTEPDAPELDPPVPGPIGWPAAAANFGNATMAAWARSSPRGPAGFFSDATTRDATGPRFRTP